MGRKSPKRINAIKGEPPEGWTEAAAIVSEGAAVNVAAISAAGTIAARKSAAVEKEYTEARKKRLARMDKGSWQRTRQGSV